MKNLFVFFLAVSLLFSCKKETNNITTNNNSNQNTTSNNDWYIYEMYGVYDEDPNSTPINLSGNGPDYRLNFKSDGTIYLYLLSVPSAQPSYWGAYTTSSITFGSGGAGSLDFQIISQTSTMLKAKKTGIGISYFLTLKK
jgi:hypothetical protein